MRANSKKEKKKISTVILNFRPELIKEPVKMQYKCRNCGKQIPASGLPCPDCVRKR